MKYNFSNKKQTHENKHGTVTQENAMLQGHRENRTSFSAAGTSVAQNFSGGRIELKDQKRIA